MVALTLGERNKEKNRSNGGRPGNGRPNRNLRDSPDLFDESLGYDDETGIEFARGLTALDRRRATLLYRLFNELWGLCIVKGGRGAGKDLFGNYLAYTIKRYFPWKRILRDEKPRKLFGPYAGLFNEAVLQGDFKQMSKIAKGIKKTEVDSVMDKVADDWAQGAGEVMLKNSVLYVTEYWNWCYNREPHKPINKTMGAVHRISRHLDCLVIGTAQLTSDLDKHTCLPYVDWEVTCTRSASNVTGFVYYIQKVKYDQRLNMLIPLGRPFPMPLDAGRPRSELGDGKIRITNRGRGYRPETEEERVVLDVLKTGVDTYEGMVDLLDEEGDMSEREVLDTLKGLGLKLPNRRPKMVIDYPCFFKIYNSKAASQLKTGVKVLED